MQIQIKVSAAGEQLAFSIMLNNFFSPDRSINLREDFDVIPVWLAEIGKQ